MNEHEEQTLKQAINGDINAFQQLFVAFQEQLKSYLYRLVADRNDADDLTHDTFIRAYDKLHQFRGHGSHGEASLKTWVFQIATSLAYNYLARQKRWTPNVMEQAKELVTSNRRLAQAIEEVAQNSPQVRYAIQEHIDTCFTCMAKTLPVENQIALILKDMYSFSVREIGVILDKSEGVVKYLLQTARGTMTEIFEQRCALVNQAGVCHQCSELNGWLNPKQDQQAALMAVDLVKGSKRYNRDELYAMRATLVRSIDPLRAPGHELQDMLMRCNRLTMGEVAEVS